MPNLTGKQILDTAMSKIHDSSGDMRAKLISWLPGIFASVLAEREWRFCPDMVKTADIEIAGNNVPLPADFDELINVAIGKQFFFSPEDLVTDERAFMLAATGGGTAPEGYQINGLILTFHPGAEGTATVKYRAEMSSVTDDETETVWPSEFLNTFVRALLTGYYEFDRHPGVGFSVVLDQAEMLRVKRIDNRRSPIPRYNNHGYVRERQ